MTGELLICIIWGICYRDVAWLLFLQIILCPYFKYMEKREERRRAARNRKGFLHIQQSLMTSLQAGYTLENACRIILEELKKLYKNDKDPIIQAFRPVVSGLSLHISVEKLFYQMAKETRVEEIWQFATVLDIALSTGGNTVEIIRNAMQQLQHKIEIEEEIRVMLSGKMYEKNIMLLMPFMIMLYLSIVNASYVAVFYNTLAGHIVITLLLLGEGICFYWTEYIMEGISIV